MLCKCSNTYKTYFNEVNIFFFYCTSSEMNKYVTLIVFSGELMGRNLILG